MPTPRAANAPSRDGWLTIDEVSRRMGVSPPTVRRWSDAGEIEAFTTPGGHRRFSRRAVEAMLASHPRERSLQELGETPERRSRVYRRVIGRMIAGTSWADALMTTGNPYRGNGERIGQSLLIYLDADDDEVREAAISVAEEACREYGSLAVDRGAGLSDTVDLFSRMRTLFLREMTSLARRRGLDTVGAIELVEATERAFDRLLRAVIDGFESRQSTPIAASLAGEGRVPATRERGRR